MRSLTVTSAFVLALSAAALSACAEQTATIQSGTEGTDAAQSAPATTGAESDMPQSANDDKTAELSAEEATALQYFEELASLEVPRMDLAAEMAAPDSNAHAFAVYLSALAQAFIERGRAIPPEAVSFADGVISACPPEGECSEFSDIEWEDGLIANFAPGGSSLEGRIHLGDGEVQHLHESGDASLIAAYLNPDGTLTAIWDFDAKMDDAGFTAIYVLSDEEQIEAHQRVSQESIMSGDRIIYALIFDTDELGGDLAVFPFIDGQWAEPPIMFPTQ